MKFFLVIGFLLLAPLIVFSQVEPTSQLYSILRSKDSLLFTAGFNTGDTTAFVTLVSEDFEFYHDEAGITSSKSAFIASIISIGKLPYKPRRQLVENSLAVYPLKKNGVLYGAVQTGEHQFYGIEKGKPEYLTSTAKFNHLWLLENGQWKLSRVISYDHEQPAVIGESLLFKNRVETEKWLVKNHIPALGIGYIKNGKIQEVTVYGKNKSGNPNPKNTIFNVASLTKPITAMIVMKLIDAGQWDLDEPLYMYWTDPDVAGDPGSKLLTTRHILSHKSGFANWRYLHPDGKLIFEFDPGTKYQYSGEGFEYLRRALESKFKKTLDQLARELIFQPLKMNDTRFFWDSSMDESRFAPWHKGDGSLYDTYKNTSANAADDLLTTIEDYCTFMVHIMNGADLKPELYKQMISEQTRIKPRKYFGLGWSADEDVKEGENALTHGGDDKGVHAIAFILPKSKEGLLIFTNCDNGTDIYIPTVQYYLGKAGQEIIDIETK